MNRNNPTTPYAALGIAGQMGCFIVILVIGALFAGLWLDRTLGTGRIATLICVIGSVPITIGLTLFITQRMIKRLIPLDPVKKAKPGDSNPGEDDY
jgi:hypothetical protein